MYLVGYVVKPQGISGELKIEPVTPNPERFKILKHVFIQKNDFQKYSIRSIRIDKKFVYLKFAEITDRESAEFLRNCEVFIEEDDLLPLGENEFYLHDLIGCRVISDEGKLIGELQEVVQITSNDVYVVKNQDGEEFLIPAIKDVIRTVDINRKEIIIHIIDGLLD